MIINNLTRNNHLFHLNKLFQNAKRIYIISPFITSNLSLFDFSSLKALQKITIITTLKSFDKDQYSKATYFKELYTIFNSNNIEFDILIDNSMHGKIFIGEEDEQNLEAIITSANFTDSGLRISNEWGVLINDYSEINKIKTAIIKKIKYKTLNESNIDIFLSKIKEFPKPNAKENPVKLNLSLLFEEKDNYFELDDNVTFWLKPIGVTNDVIPITRKFDEIDSDLHFSKLKPKGVKKGDVLICYAVGHLNILSIYRVKSDVKNTDNKNDRWPYYVIGENLTPNYGREWLSQKITITNQKNTFLQQGLFNITPSGKNSFGSLMRGADKLRLTKDFGVYLLDKISNINSELEEL